MATAAAAAAAGEMADIHSSTPAPVVVELFLVTIVVVIIIITLPRSVIVFAIVFMANLWNVVSSHRSGELGRAITRCIDERAVANQGSCTASDVGRVGVHIPTIVWVYLGAIQIDAPVAKSGLEEWVEAEV